jgi:2-hydroxychromene-2-carboxylate isomerase
VAPAPQGSRQPTFYYDLGSPSCYLVAECVLGALPVVPEWEPVQASALGIELRESDRDVVARRVAELGLQPLRWPDPCPPDTTTATLTAAYAKRIGRAVAFSLAAFRQAFAGGRDLGSEDTVLLAAAASEMHPAAVLKGITLRATIDALAEAHDRARMAGVDRLPAIAVGARVFTGEAALEHAAETLGALREGGR